MDAKLSNFSEFSNILSVKSSLRTCPNLMTLLPDLGLDTCSAGCLWRNKFLRKNTFFCVFAKYILQHIRNKGKQITKL